MRINSGAVDCVQSSKEVYAARAVSQGEGVCDRISEQSCCVSVRIG